MRLQICILTPDRIFRNEEVEELILPTSTGQIGVLSGHAPLIPALDIGPIIIFHNSSWTAVAVIGGFALVRDNNVTILVNDAVDASSLSKDSAEKSLEAAKTLLNEAVGEKEKVAATFSFKRARARYQITH
jgi:ATP synthase F1 epsilon subunit